MKVVIVTVVEFAVLLTVAGGLPAQHPLVADGPAGASRSRWFEISERFSKKARQIPAPSREDSAAVQDSLSTLAQSL